MKKAKETLLVVAIIFSLMFSDSIIDAVAKLFF